MIVQLMQAKPPSAPPLPVAPASTKRVEVVVEVEDAERDKEARSSTNADGKSEFPHWYSPECRSLTLILIIEVTHLSWMH
jgi:hypothetical protein